MASKGEDPDELRLLLVGCTLAGKSATGNSLLLKKEDSFEERNIPGIGILAKASADPLETGRLITIIDTPEISETWLNSYNIEGERFMDLVRPGPHAILLVVRVKRFDEVDEEKVKLLHKILGKECSRYMVVVFTNIDGISTRGKSTFDAWLSNIRKNELMDSVLKECDERHLKLDNSIDHDESEDQMKAAQNQVHTLLAMVEEMVNQNDKIYNQKFYPIEYLKRSEDAFIVRKMKQLVVATPAGFISTFAVGIGFYHVLASLEEHISARLVVPVGCLLPIATLLVYGREKNRLIPLLTNERNKRTKLVAGLSSGFIFASLLVFSLDTLSL